MADATWTSTKWGKPANARFHSATINSTDADTAILYINPLTDVSITIDHGGTDSLVVSLANDEGGQSIVAGSDAAGTAITISNDYTANIGRGFTAIKVTGATVDSHVVRITEVR